MWERVAEMAVSVSERTQGDGQDPTGQSRLLLILQGSRGRGLWDRPLGAAPQLQRRKGGSGRMELSTPAVHTLLLLPDPLWALCAGPLPALGLSFPM